MKNVKGRKILRAVRPYRREVCIKKLSLGLLTKSCLQTRRARMSNERNKFLVGTAVRFPTRLPDVSRYLAERPR